MRTSRTTRQRTGFAVSLCLFIAAAIAIALSSTYPVNHRHPSQRSILASKGHPGLNRVHRDFARAERARQRTAPHFAYLLVAAYRLPVDSASRMLAIAPRAQLWRDPVHVVSGRSPPLCFS